MNEIVSLTIYLKYVLSLIYKMHHILWVGLEPWVLINDSTTCIETSWGQQATLYFN